MSWVLHLISLNPDVMKKLVEEIDSFNEEISIQSLKSLKYLDNVIHETLRFYPSVPAAARSAKSDDILPSGMVVKKNERVTINTQFVHRNKKYWDNPDDFIPERWDESPIKHPFQYIPFYGGPMVCIGKPLALLEAKTYLVLMLKNYTFQRDEKHTVVVRRSLTLTAENGIKMILTKR